VKNGFFPVQQQICSNKFLRWFLSHPNGYFICLATPGIFPGLTKFWGLSRSWGPFDKLTKWYFASRVTPLDELNLIVQ
jgi:hypothetical protein